MRGEIPAPAEQRRMQELKREIRKLCTGTDKQLKNLKRMYAANPAVMQTLNEYEPDIEAADSRTPKNRRTAVK